jgi:DNA repair protein RadC
MPAPTSTPPAPPRDALRVAEAGPVRAARPRLLELPASERPRERLAALGPEALSSRELIAILIGAGTRRASALEIGERLAGGGLRAIQAASLGELAGHEGLGPARASRLLAALELGARAASEGRSPLPELRTPAEAARLLLPRYASRPVETFGVLALDVRHRLRREAIVSTGSLTSSLVHPREVFQQAVLARAAAIVVFHNHPSGDPEPSAEDLSLTRRLAAAGTLMGIELVDHLILGAGRYVSLKERGVL